MQSRRLTSVAAGGALVALLAACSTGTGSTGGGGGGSGGGGSSSSLKTGPGVDSSAKTITVGEITPLSGAAEVIGKPLTAGIQTYFDKVNAAGGVDGWKIKTQVQDDAYDPQKHAQIYSQMVGNVAMIAQSLGSPTTAAIEKQASGADVVLGTAAQDSAFVNQKVNAVIGTPYAVDDANAMNYVSQKAPHAKVALFYQNDAYGQDGIRGYTAGVNAYHLNSVAKVSYNATDTSFTAQATALKKSGAQYVLLTAIPTPAATLIGTAAQLGYHPQWILQGPAWSEYLMTSTGTPGGKPTPVEPALEGAWVLGYEAQWGDTSVPGMKQFLADTKKYAPKQPPDGYYMYGYCMGQLETAILKKAIESNDLSRQGILNAKLNVGTVNFGGLIPTAHYSPTLGPADRETDIATVSAKAGSSGFLKTMKPFFESSAARTLQLGS
jgi:ABC-type branched-subunit amino acid transport system substrate-binding protein